MPQIIVKQGDKVIDRLNTEKKTIKIGRESKNDILLDNPGVSRLHSELNFFDDYAFVIDKQSTNGTYVNGKKITEAQIGESDVISIGNYTIHFKLYPEKKGDSIDPDQFKILSPSMPQKPPLSAETVVVSENLSAEPPDAAEAGVARNVLKAVQNADFTEYVIDKSSLIIGKGNTVDIRVKGLLVAQVQARISKDKDNYVLTNVGKRKLTTVNGEEISKTFLKEEDTIQIGKTIFVFTKEHPK